MNIAVFCASSRPTVPTFFHVAEQLGIDIAQRGHTLVYGGSNLGLMGAVSTAALQAGGSVTAVIPTLFSEEVIASQVVTQLVRVSSMAERKEYIIAHSDAFIALPGGIGTLDEITEVMVANQLQHLGKPMILLNVDGFYDPFLAQLRLIQDRGLLRTDCGLRIASTVDSCWSALEKEEEWMKEA